MASTRLSLFISAALMLEVVLGAWPPGYVRRVFYDTPKGAIHYVVRGNVSGTAPLIFFHGHPRSTEQIKLLMLNIPKSQPFIAVDYFGAGSSDECQCDESKDEFVTYNVFAQWVLNICDAEGVQKLIPFGALTGGGPAFELAWLAAKKGRAAAMVQFEAYYLSPKAKAYIDSTYIPSIRHLPINVNGSHLAYWWVRPDAGPIGPTHSGPVAADLLANSGIYVSATVGLGCGCCELGCCEL